MQVSDQAVRLWQEGWFQSSAEPSGVSILRDPKARHRRSLAHCCLSITTPLLVSCSHSLRAILSISLVYIFLGDCYFILAGYIT